MRIIRWHTLSSGPLQAHGIMGGTTSRVELPVASVSLSVNPKSDKPYFFLASCPRDSLYDAISLADRYGGFHCVGDGDEGFTAWRGKAEGQFLTLKRLSPSGRKVVGIAIAGFGHCNNEREFLRQLASKRGHEQFELKQCGDIRDMERWLLSEGYGPASAASADPPPLPGDTGRTQAVGASVGGGAGLWASVGASLFGSSLTAGASASAAPGASRGGGAARRERSLMDLQQALQEAEAADDSSVESLREAWRRLLSALQAAQQAGVSNAELALAREREHELQQLAQAAEGRRSCWRWCCCTDAREWRRVEEARLGEECYNSHAAVGRVSTFVESQASALDEKIQALEQDIRQRERELEHQKLSMRTVLPARAGGGRLPVGTKCRYKSPRNGWLTAHLEGFNASDGTCNLDVRQHAKLENIYPAADVPESKAWPPGTLVEYESSTAGQWLKATILSFNEGIGSKEGSYNLDLRERASVDRIRLRLA